MGGLSCDLEGAQGGTSNGVSPASVVNTDIPPEKVCVSAEGACDLEAESDDGCSLEAEMCIGFSKSISLGVTKGLQKCATFPSSSGQTEQEGSSCHHADDGLKEAPAYERSVSLPPTLKLISAMKGGRQKNGMASPTENRHVKWAPDVYDPPVTSVCHSVTSSYQRRPKPRKKDKNKQKKPKARSKKNHQSSVQNSSVLKAPDLGLEDVDASCDQSAPHKNSKHESMILDYSMGNQDAKCGSSFLRESVAKMHFSIAEAS